MGYSGFIYKWTNNINGKKYIGSHKGMIDDGYVGSGTAFLAAIKKYGKENFTREILEIIESNDDLLIRENYYLKLFDVKNDRRYYNMKDCATGGHCIDLENMRAGWKDWATENLMKKVYKFDMYGNFLEEFDSLTEAAKSVSASSPSNIKYTCDGKFSSAYGFLWSWDNTPPSCGDPLKSKGKKRVQTPDGLFDSVTKVVEHYQFSSTKMVRHRCLSTKEKWTNWKYVFEGK